MDLLFNTYYFFIFLNDSSNATGCAKNEKSINIPAEFCKWNIIIFYFVLCPSLWRIIDIVTNHCSSSLEILPRGRMLNSNRGVHGGVWLINRIFFIQDIIKGSSFQGQASIFKLYLPRNKIKKSIFQRLVARWIFSRIFPSSWM